MVYGVYDVCCVLCRHVLTQLFLPLFLPSSPSLPPSLPPSSSHLPLFHEGRALIAILVCVCAVITYNVWGPNRYDCCNQVKEGDGETGGDGGERER